MRHFLLLSKSSVIVVLPAVFASRCANSKTSFNFFSKPSHKQQPGFVYKIKTLSLSGTSFEEDGEEHVQESPQEAPRAQETPSIRVHFDM